MKVKISVKIITNQELVLFLTIEENSLFVKEVYVDSARMLKRLRPAPQGRAHRIRKRSNHVTLVVGLKQN